MDKVCELKVSDFILKTTFSRVKLCVETKHDIKIQNCELQNFPHIALYMHIFAENAQFLITIVRKKIQTQNWRI